ncbi:MAG: ice-binding family protein [Gemmatimonadota bacterium]|nr:ice-binding family protein [Gemmatimonadota bacterium]
MKIPTNRAPRAPHTPFKTGRWVVAAALVAVMSASCDVHSPSGPGDIATITVTPDATTMEINGTQQFTATAVDGAGNAISITPTWSVEAGGGTIDASGIFTAGTTTGTFENTVVATSGAISGSATVTVTAGPAESLTVSPDPQSMLVNSVQEFTATAEDAGGNPVTVTPTWSVEAGGGTIDASTGVFTAGSVGGTFTNTVMATSGTLSGFATVTVVAANDPASILGAAEPNGIIAGTEVTCIDLGTIDADVSIHPGSDVSGFPPCTITGVQELATAVAEQAQIDLVNAYDQLAGLPCDPSNAIVADLGGTTLPAGVYCTESGIGVTGTLTLDGGGDPDAVFIFQAGTSLTTAGDVVLINGAQAANVYWQVSSSATLGTASQWQGNILALTSITLVDNANLNGRALARNGAVSLGTNNTITLP